MALTLDLETLFLKALNTSYIYPITSKVCFVKGLANYINFLTYISNMIHICPNISCQFSPNAPKCINLPLLLIDILLNNILHHICHPKEPPNPCYHPP